MPHNQNKLSQFWQELKRRKVVRVITVYAAAAFVILELVDIITEPFGLPDWTMILVVVLLTVGFIIAVILSWIYDIHPEGGIVKTEPADKVKQAVEPKSSNSWRIASYISFVAIVGLIVFNIFGGTRGSRIDESLAKSIAVLPFHNFSGDPGQDYMCEGLTDEIISHLFKVRSFDEVRSLTSVLPYKDSEKSATEIAEALNVNYILAGSYKRMGDELKITAQLIESKSDNHIWLEDYEFPYSEVMGIPGEIALQIAEHLKTFIADDEKQSIRRLPSENLEAYNLYLKGRYFWHMATGETFKKAKEYFEQAIQKDPNYALAYTGIAMIYYQNTFWGNIPPNEAYPIIKGYVEKALELDNTLAEAHILLGNINRAYYWNWKAAEQNYKKAIQLNPNSADIHMFYSFLLTYTERNEEAIFEAKRAQALDPLSSWVNANLGAAYLSAHEYDKAIEALQMILTINPDHFLPHLHLGTAYEGKLMIEEAIAEYEKAVNISDENPYAMSLLIAAYYEFGQKAKAEKLFDSLKQRSRDEYIPSTCFCLIHKVRGEMDLYYEWLEKACNEHDSFLPWFRVFPIERYRFPDEPRFNELLKKAGLEKYRD
jgi:adenylate cyclase